MTETTTTDTFAGFADEASLAWFVTAMREELAEIRALLDDDGSQNRPKLTLVQDGRS